MFQGSHSNEQQDISCFALGAQYQLRSLYGSNTALLSTYLITKSSYETFHEETTILPFISAFFNLTVITIRSILQFYGIWRTKHFYTCVISSKKQFKV